MTSITPNITGASPSGAPIAVTSSDTQSKAQNTSFDPMPFIDGSIDRSSDSSRAKLLTLGMTAPIDASAGFSQGGSDVQAVSAAADRPFNLSEVSAMFLEFMLTYRQAARLDRQSSLEGQMKELMGSAQKMRDSAKSAFNAALAQGIASIVGGVIQGAIGAAQFKVMSQMKQTINTKSIEPELPKSPELNVGGPGAKSSTSSNRLTVSIEGEGSGAKSNARASGPAQQHYLDEIDKLDMSPATPKQTSKSANAPASMTADQQKQWVDYLSSKNQLLGALQRSATGILVEGPAQVVAAVYNKESGVERAESQEADARAKKAEASYSASNEEAQTAREAFNKVLDMVAEIDRSRSETSKSIARI